MLIAPIADVVKSLEERNVIDGVAKLDEPFHDKLKFLSPECDPCEIQDTTKMLNSDGPVVFGGSFVILEKH